jgi:hypothetical protein
VVKVHGGQSSAQGQDAACAGSGQYDIRGLYGQVALLCELTNNQESEIEDLKKTVSLFIFFLGILAYPTSNRMRHT